MEIMIITENKFPCDIGLLGPRLYSNFGYPNLGEAQIVTNNAKKNLTVRFFPLKVPLISFVASLFIY